MSSKQINRRQAIKILAVAAGTAGLSLVPSKWKTPVVDVGVLPAHAQGSLRTGTITGGVFVQQQGTTRLKYAGVVPLIAGALVAVDGTGLSATTGQNGLYAITNVPPGTYNLTCTPPSGGLFYFPINPASGQLTGVVVPAGGTTPNHNFYFGID